MLRTLASLVLLLGVAAACGPVPAPAAPPSNQVAAPVPAPVDGRQYVGDPAAAVAITYWFDYQCPFCVELDPTLEQLERRYGDQIVVYYKNFPLAQHTDARAAAIAAEAARRQGQYIEMHRLLFARSPRHAPDELRDAADQLGLDLPRFDADVRDPAAAAAIDREYAEGERTGLQGVPTLMINGAEYTGELELGALAAVIDARLGQER